MNSTQKQSILDAIEEFKKTDLITPFKNKYKDAATLDNIVVSEYSIAELFAIAQRAVSQLEDFLENGNWRIIPCDNIPITSYGNITLKNVIINITNYFKSANYEHVISQVKPLVYYEMRCGFWDQPKRIELGIRESSLKALEQRAELTMSHIQTREDKVKSLIDNLENKKTEIDQLIKTKKQEFEILKNNQSESNTILNDIKNSLKTATTTESSIDSLNNKAKTILTTLESSQTKVEDQIKSSKDNLVESENALNKFKNESDSKIKEITSNFLEVSNNTEEVRKMMGYIADGTLSHSFNKRKKEITISIRWWGFWTILSLLALVAWIYVVFTYFSANTSNEWANIIINSIKSSPLAFVFGYALTQLSKERTIKEEYAYRESVALTLTAYLEQLGCEDNKEKQNLLLQTIEKLYEKPNLANSDSVSSIKVNSKDLTDAISNFAEAVKAFKK